MNAVAKPPKSAIHAPAARTPRNWSRLTTEAVKIPSGIAAPKWRAAQINTADIGEIIAVLSEADLKTVESGAVGISDLQFALAVPSCCAS